MSCMATAEFVTLPVGQLFRPVTPLFLLSGHVSEVHANDSLSSERVCRDVDNTAGRTKIGQKRPDSGQKRSKNDRQRPGRGGGCVVLFESDRVSEVRMSVNETYSYMAEKSCSH